MSKSFDRSIVVWDDCNSFVYHNLKQIANSYGTAISDMQTLSRGGQRGPAAKDENDSSKKRIYKFEKDAPFKYKLIFILAVDQIKFKHDTTVRMNEHK